MQRGFMLQPVPGDGSCLYSSIGFIVGMNGQDMRHKLEQAFHQWSHIFQPIDPAGVLASQTLAEIRHPLAWGGEAQITVAATILGCRIRVHMLAGWAADYGTSSPLYHLLYRNREYPQVLPTITISYLTVRPGHLCLPLAFQRSLTVWPTVLRPTPRCRMYLVQPSGGTGRLKLRTPPCANASCDLGPFVLFLQTSEVREMPLSGFAPCGQMSS